MANSKFHHEEIHRGKDLVLKLARKHITVCGCGAIGSNLVENLVRQGFTKIRVIDMDRVETHNLNTQIFEESDRGAMKVAACQRKVFKAVGTEIETEDKELKSANIKKFLKGTDLVIDAFDNSASRKLLYDYGKENKIPVLHVGLEASYCEVVWNDAYTVPQDVEGDVCDYPLTRNIVMASVMMASEEILDFCLADKPRMKNWCFTLNDMKIGQYK
jgi:molybdopterin/thiamine biosynthesis adenylyltransferase